jgi:hypothetical protein
MKKLMIKKREGKEGYYEQAHSLFISGIELAQIAKDLQVPLNTLQEWQTVGLWERKKELVTGHPKLMGEALKGLVKQKVQKILDSGDQININNIEELTKIINLVDRLEEHSWDERAAVVEVMSLFGKFARQQVEEKEELQILVKLMEKFFEEMEGS